MVLEEKYVVLDNALLRYYNYNFHFFPQKSITHLEVGFGNGEYLLNFALQKEQEYFFGIEYSKKYFDKAFRKVYKHNVKNIKLLFGEAYTLIYLLIPDNFFDYIHINFPDPWPKKRHMERRLLSLSFINELKRILKNGGKIFFASDVEDYFLNSVYCFEKSGFLINYFSSLPYSERLAKTKYEKEFIRLGKKIFYSVLKKS